MTERFTLENGVICLWGHTCSLDSIVGTLNKQDVEIEKLLKFQCMVQDFFLKHYKYMDKSIQKDANKLLEELGWIIVKKKESMYMKY